MERYAETEARVTAPQHILRSSFREHQQIEGYFENRSMPGFSGSDRLLKLDTLYGTIQLGYNPREGAGFLFANIKPSIYGAAASRYQREMKESQMMKDRRTDTQNLAFSARRQADSAVILYKRDNLPWSRRSLEPYLRRMNMEALQKTMPFLTAEQEQDELAIGRQKRREGWEQLRAALKEGNAAKAAEVRSEDTARISEEVRLQSLILKKGAAAQNFFRRLNNAFDYEKTEMFAYYRRRPVKNDGRAAEETGPEKPAAPDGEDDE